MKLVVFFFLSVNLASAKIGPEQKIWKCIMEEYSPACRPILNASHPINISADIQPVKLIEVVCQSYPDNYN